MSYERMNEKEKALKAEVEKLLEEAARTDAEEDAKYGKGKRGDELPAELARRDSRLKKIVEAKAALEQEARERAVAEKAAVEARLQEREKQEEERGKKIGGGAAGGEERGGGSETARAEKTGGGGGQEKRRAPAASARPGASQAGAEGPAELHRSGFADHEGRGGQKFRAGLQRSGGSGCHGTSDCGLRDHTASQRQTAVGADATASGTEPGEEAGEGYGRFGLFQRGCGNGSKSERCGTAGATGPAETGSDHRGSGRSHPRTGGGTAERRSFDRCSTGSSKRGGRHAPEVAESGRERGVQDAQGSGGTGVRAD